MRKASQSNQFVVAVRRRGGRFVGDTKDELKLRSDGAKLLHGPETDIHLKRIAQEENTIERVASFHVAMSNRPIVPVHPTRPRRDDFLQFVLSRNA